MCSRPRTRLVNPCLPLSLSTKIRPSYIWKSISYRAVQTSYVRPNLPKFPVNFLGPRGNANSIQKSHLHCMPLMQSSPNLSSKRSLLKPKIKIVLMLPLRPKLSQNSHNFVLVLSIPTTPIPITLLSSFPEVLPCYQRTFTRRRSQQLMEPSEQRICLIPPAPFCNNCSASL